MKTTEHGIQQIHVGLDLRHHLFGVAHIVALLADAAAIEQRVLHGIPGTSMPAWRDVLEPEEIAAIIAYIRESFSSAEDAPR